MREGNKGVGEGLGQVGNFNTDLEREEGVCMIIAVCRLDWRRPCVFFPFFSNSRV